MFIAKTPPLLFGTQSALTYQSANSNASALTTYTFSAQQLGAQTEDRETMLLLMFGGFTGTLNSVNVDGNFFQLDDFGGSNRIAWGPSRKQQADIVIKLGNAPNNCIVVVYSVKNRRIRGNSFVDRNEASGTGTTATQAALKIPHQGFVVGLVPGPGATQTAGTGGVVKDYEQNLTTFKAFYHRPIERGPVVTPSMTATWTGSAAWTFTTWSFATE